MARLRTTIGSSTDRDRTAAAPLAPRLLINNYAPSRPTWMDDVPLAAGIASQVQLRGRAALPLGRHPCAAPLRHLWPGLGLLEHLHGEDLHHRWPRRATFSTFPYMREPSGPMPGRRLCACRPALRVLGISHRTNKRTPAPELRFCRRTPTTE